MTIDDAVAQALAANQQKPVWDPVAQIYVGGVVPGVENEELQAMIRNSQGALRIFGYGSLCWNPGAGALGRPAVTSTLGRAIGYRRCWAQKSTDHRGTPDFPGIVCTLLKDEEYREIVASTSIEQSLTEGVIYTVPPELVQECLAELDFREKGGYARDIISVFEDDSGETVQALLYRGTPDNPSMWPRVLRDLPLAAAIMSVAIGPSGPNHVYLNQLDQFLLKAATPGTLEKFDDTFALNDMVQRLRQKISSNLYFLFGCGSNQHNQLLLRSDGNVARLHNDDQDAHEMSEIAMLCTTTTTTNEQVESRDPLTCPLTQNHDRAARVFAGGGHSGLLTERGRLYLFGWNERGQLGSAICSRAEDAVLPVHEPLSDILVETAALGHAHSLVVERETGRLYAFGDNSKCQVTGEESSTSNIPAPTTPMFLENDHVVHAAAGVFHSAVVTGEGELVAFGCSRFGQSLLSGTTQRWKPQDAKIVNVACGQRHTVALDDQGRIWTFGDNKYGQLGRETTTGVAGATGNKGKDSKDATPRLVTLPPSEGDWFVFQVDCGWSHTVALARRRSQGSGSEEVSAFGWGRNDKGQLGTGDREHVRAPKQLSLPRQDEIESISCGSESTGLVTKTSSVFCCGWNEHGNLGIAQEDDEEGETTTGNDEEPRDCLVLQQVSQSGAAFNVWPPTGSSREESKLCIANGGAHLLVMQVPKK